MFPCLLGTLFAIGGRRWRLGFFGEEVCFLPVGASIAPLLRLWVTEPQVG